MNSKSTNLKNSLGAFLCLLSTLFLFHVVVVQQALADENVSGDPMLYALDAQGHVIRRTEDNGGHTLHRGEIMTIAVNNIF
ncbi:MAG: hypothetical protein Q7T18_05680, partial [Sedimentisphaerales bacterium]|nr:hypothetical protein [Sedimentisphaerales bacterium]